MTTATKKLAVLLTGNELMTGDIVDSNSAMMAELLSDLGLHIDYKVTIADDLAVLVAELKRLSESYDVLIVNGGLGPTTDDLTAEALAKVQGIELEIHPQAMSHLEALCKQYGIELNESNKKQALLPKDCDTLANPVGTALGLKAAMNGCQVFCTPGVPGELKLMLKQHMLPQIAELIDTQYAPMRHRLRVFGFGESKLQQALSDAFPEWPKEIELGFRASIPILELKLQAVGKQNESLLNQWREKMFDLLGDHIIGETSKPMAQVVLEELEHQALSITCAESCTGGLIASNLTRIDGASRVFNGSFVTYSNEMKENLLSVSKHTLEENGAVSEPVVREMLLGALRKTHADIGVAVSGIAGPNGGTKEKPVGTVCIAWGSISNNETTTLYVPGSRSRFQDWVSAAALDLVRRKLIASTQTPQYIKTKTKPR